jgi:hypothetical protein
MDYDDGLKVDQSCVEEGFFGTESNECRHTTYGFYNMTNLDLWYEFGSLKDPRL